VSAFDRKKASTYSKKPAGKTPKQTGDTPRQNCPPATVNSTAATGPDDALRPPLLRNIVPHARASRGVAF